MPKISVVIPVYKVEKFLPRCLDSIIAQTFEDWECILVDDGSPDSSGAICDTYATKDSRFKVFHKENGGVSTARNYALDKAQGCYVTFVDSDDWIDKDCLEKCMSEMAENTLDLLQFGLKRVSSSGRTLSATVLGSPVVNIKKYIELEKFNVCVCGSIYRLDIIQQFKLRFIEGMNLGEDQLFFFDYLKHTDKARSISQTFYCYYLNYRSATARAKSTDIIRSMKIIGESAAFHPEAANHFSKVLNSYLSNLLNNCDISSLEFVKLYRMYYNPLVLNNLTLYTKISSINPYLAYYICGFMNRCYLKTRTLIGYFIHKVI